MYKDNIMTLNSAKTLLTNNLPVYRFIFIKNDNRLIYTREEEIYKKKEMSL